MVYNYFGKNIMDTTVFGKNLIRLRKERLLSQRDLAKETGISQRLIHHYEKYSGNPPLDKIEKIAKALNVTMDELLTTKGKSIKQNKNEVLQQLNSKTLSRIKQILSLTPEERHMVYSLIDSILIKKEALKSRKTKKAS